MPKYFFIWLLFAACTKIMPVSTRSIIVDGNSDTITIQRSLTGDDYSYLQAALNYQAANPGTKLLLTDTSIYHSSHGLLFAKLNASGTDYGQVELDLAGPINARNTPVSATIKFTNTEDFGLAIQNCKGCEIKNINFIGAYSFPSILNAQQIDTLFFDEWAEPQGSSKTSPYAGIVVDPFSDPAYYTGNYKMYPSYISNYISGMSLGGSTAIDIENCQITNFVAGVMITPSMQENGELINITRCRIDNCKVAYAYSQAQSKANTLNDLMSWGNCHTIVDGCSYGFKRGDGSTSPMVDVMNIAGYNHQLYNLSAASFPISWNNVYAETLFKLGYVRNNYAGTNFSNFQIDFQSDKNLPSPDFYIGGDFVNWSNCMLRLYNDNATTRLILNANGNIFREGVINNPPIKTSYNNTTIQPYFDHTTMYYTAGYVMNLDYDSLVYLGSGPLLIDRRTFTGYFISDKAASCQHGDEISGRQTYLDQFTWDGSNVTPVGFVDNVNGDTVFIAKTGWGWHSGDHPDLFVDKIKQAQ